jgi:hypothetical protein
MELHFVSLAYCHIAPTQPCLPLPNAVCLLYRHAWFIFERSRAQLSIQRPTTLAEDFRGFIQSLLSNWDNPLHYDRTASVQFQFISQNCQIVWLCLCHPFHQHLCTNPYTYLPHTPNYPATFACPLACIVHSASWKPVAMTRSLMRGRQGRHCCNCLKILSFYFTVPFPAFFIIDVAPKCHKLTDLMDYYNYARME